MLYFIRWGRYGLLLPHLHKGAIEDEMVGWHHQLNGYVFEQNQGHSEGQGSLVCWSPCGHKELDSTEQLNNNSNILTKMHCKHSETLVW